ncbi:hypothetical protein [Clostridium sp. Marseille-Q7071]
MEELFKNITELIEKIENSNIKCKAVVGFDGFVDELVHAVDIRKSPGEYERIKTLKSFGERISKAAGLSTNIEKVPLKIKLGGNGPIMCDALINLGLDLTYIGALGEDDIHEVFKDMTKNCRTISICNPSYTEAYEFEDGKLITSKQNSMKEINWDLIDKKIGLSTFRELIEECKLLAMVNWTTLPYMNEILENMISKINPYIKSTDKFVFFDLADIEKRTEEDVIKVLNLISNFNLKFKAILGLNKKECFDVAKVLKLPSIDGKNYNNMDLRATCREISENIDVYAVVVHPVDEALSYCNGTYYHTLGSFTANPKITTGAGDNFNAGFCFGQLLDLSIQLSLLLGTAVSGYYVREGKSPNKEELVNFLKDWRDTL